MTARETKDGNQAGLDPSFGKGKFHVSHAADAEFDGGLRGYFEYRDLGMVEATGGKVRAHVIRPSGPYEKPGDLHTHNLDYQMVYVLKGWARVFSRAWAKLASRKVPACIRNRASNTASLSIPTITP